MRINDWMINEFRSLFKEEEDDYIQPVEDGYVHHVYTLFNLSLFPVYNFRDDMKEEEDEQIYDDDDDVESMPKSRLLQSGPIMRTKTNWFAVAALAVTHRHTIWIVFFFFFSFLLTKDLKKKRVVGGRIFADPFLFPS